MQVVVLGVLALVLFLGLPTIMVSGWLRWSQNPRTRKGASPKISSISFSFATVSFLLGLCAIAYLLIYGGFSAVTSGYRGYDPLLLSVYRAGIVVSAFSLLLGIIGTIRKGVLRWHAPLASVGMLLFWFLAATGE